MADRKTKGENDERAMEASPATMKKRGTNAQRGDAGSVTEVTREYREIQNKVDQQDAQRQQKQQQKEGQQKQSQQKQRQSEGVQTSDRVQPTPPFPTQHPDKPGLESQIDPRPRYEAPDYKGSEKLQDMVAIITGGDSGIGRAVAVLYAREGADVAIVYLPVEQADAEETKAAVEREGRECLLLPGDVSDFEFCKQVVDRTRQQFGRLDILVNNAAFQEHANSIDELSVEHFDRTIKTNLYGYFYMAKAALPHLKRGGAIINTGSVTGLSGNKELLDYSMTKGGIHAFTRSLSENVIERGIRVNAVAPGPVWTPLNPADGPAKSVSSFGSDSPMKRPAQPEELSPVYVFLAAPSCSSYITGEVIPVVGGYQSR